MSSYKAIAFGAMLFASGFIFNEVVEIIRDKHELQMKTDYQEAKINAEIRQRNKKGGEISAKIGFNTSDILKGGE